MNYIRRKLTRLLNDILYHSDDIKNLYQMHHKNEARIKKLEQEEKSSEKDKRIYGDHA